ncbi:hypothetical protein GCM10010172_07630 [Paractinoplanes ferrugineus]|uniref:Uncharacterized protein n=1 Tax=Paractinoplanes ferrugineus TaxID=113564 RepID=A0A919JGN6_9ACTN|nr:hypothetical protein [Actinoplanes ferrugineus]GIE16866.1 hypothetical protein Afe05nite_87060 [Actinoplanes ferrugineus]
MSYRSETAHHVGGDTVTVKQLAGLDEFHVFMGLDKFEIFRGNETDPGTDPANWYTEIGGVVEGPYDTAEQLIDELFLAVEL